MADDTRQCLLEEATRLTLYRGFNATSVSALMTAAGVSKGTLYHHFPGKDDVAFAVLARAKAALLAGIDEALHDRPAVEGLQRMCDFVLQQQRLQNFAGGCIFGNTALEMGDAGPRYAEIVTKVFDEWRQRIEAVLEKGQQSGGIRLDMRPQEMAGFILAAIEGGIMMSRLTKSEAPLAACLKALKDFTKPRGWLGEGEGR